MITPLVREGFDKVCKRRLKGMVNYVRKNRNRPNWINETLWQQMLTHWGTTESIKKSETASNSRNSDRDGLGPHRHVGGPKSNAQLQRQLTKEQGRDASIGDVFIKRHTKKDGTYVDEKARKIAGAYQEKMEKTLSQVSGTSDGASGTATLTTEQQNAIFLESTIVDQRGNAYGLGSLARIHGKGKMPYVISPSPLIEDLQKQLKEAQATIAQQAEENKVRMDLFVRYLRDKDPDLPAWLSPQPTEPAPQAPNPSEARATDHTSTTQP